MAKFYGSIGYGEMVNTAPGVWTEEITERQYFGDILKNASKWTNGENLNDDLVMDNRFSIVADPYLNEHFHSIRYVRWMGALWKVKSVEVLRPRLILTVGGVYNEQTT